MIQLTKQFHSRTRALLGCFLALMLFSLQPALAQSDGGDFDPGDIPDIVADGIDDVATGGIGVLDFVFERAKDGLRSTRTSIKNATTVIRRGSPTAKRLAKAYRRQQKKNQARLKRERKQMARFSKRILRIAASGADVPVSLATRTANTAKKIFTTHARAVRIEVQVQVLVTTSGGDSQQN